MLFVCHPKILHNHCLQFLLGVKVTPGGQMNKFSRNRENVASDSKSNRSFARWRQFTTTTGILFVFPFTFTFGHPGGVEITKALICPRKQNSEGF